MDTERGCQLRDRMHSEASRAPTFAFRYVGVNLICIISPGRCQRFGRVKALMAEHNKLAITGQLKQDRIGLTSSHVN